MLRRRRQIDKDLLRRQKVFGRRALIVGGVQAAGLGVLGYRYYNLQVRDHEKYKISAQKNRLRQELLEPKRGEIFDRFGEKLALNQNGFQINFTPQNNPQDSRTLLKLFKILRLPENEVITFAERLAEDRTSKTIEITSHVDREIAVAVDSEAFNLPGVEVVERETRLYPFGGLAAHVVGYVRQADENDLELDDDALLRLPGFKVGQVGVEGTMDRTLRGSAGVIEREINAHGKKKREVQRLLPAKGRDIELTIDVGLHQSIINRLSKDPNVSEGAVVVMNAHTGEVLASVSFPTYDPNGFAGRVDPQWYQSINRNPMKPQFNRVFSAQYPPASTYKMIPMLAALESGHFTADYKIKCTGEIKIETFGGEGTQSFRCWKRSGHGTLTMENALKKSCDVYMYELVAGQTGQVTEKDGKGKNKSEGEREGVGHAATIEIAKKFGLGQPVCVDLIGETPGTLPDEVFKLTTYGADWFTGDTFNASIGQGYWGASPLQLATMMSRLVNGGYAVRPYYIQPNVPYDWPKIGVDPKNLRKLREAMAQVTMDENGTAYKARIKAAGLEMGGKTGTAQVKALARGDAEAEECFLTDYRGRDHSLFIGYAPVDRPRYACAVVIEHGCGGSQTAAPIARDILTVAQLRNSSALSVMMPNRPSLREITTERKRAEQALIAQKERKEAEQTAMESEILLNELAKSADAAQQRESQR